MHRSSDCRKGFLIAGRSTSFATLDWVFTLPRMILVSIGMSRGTTKIQTARRPRATPEAIGEAGRVSGGIVIRSRRSTQDGAC